MSTLLIEGGHRLEGRVAVEGNKNAALPLLAACLLTEDECVLTNVPRIGDVEVMARLLLDLGAEVDGIGTTTLRVRAARVRHARAGSHARRPAARVGAAARAAARAASARRTSRRRAATSRRGGRSATHLEALRGDGRAAGQRRRPRARGAGRPEGRVDVSLRGVGHRHRDGAAGRGARLGRHRDPPRGDRAARRRAVRVPVEDGRRRVGHRQLEPARRGRRTAARRRARLGGDYIEAGSWAVVGGDHRRRDRHRRRARRGHRGGGGRAEAHERRLRHARRRVPRAAVEARRPPAASPRACGRRFRATSSAWSRCWRRRRRAGRSCTTGCTSCGCSRSSR